jgi:hypothetical protein
MSVVSKPTTTEYMRGSLYGLATVSIWASWIVAARLGLRTNLTPWDITAIRFGVAGSILLPYLLRKGLAVDRLGGRDWQRLCWAVGHRWYWFPTLVCYSHRQRTQHRCIPPSYPYLLRCWPLSYWRSLHCCQADRARLDCYWCPRHRLECWRHHRIATEHRSRPVHRGGHVVGLLYRGHAEGEIGRASRCCYCRGRIIDHLRARVRHHFGDQSVQRALA